MNIEDFLPKVASNTSQAVLDLCNRLVKNGKPVYLKVEATKDGKVNECYENVNQLIKEKGGRAQYGWQIWETIPGRMIEAEFHAVWVDPEGEFHDVTPKEMPGIDRILFLSDPVLSYSGVQIDNVRVSLNPGDILINRFIKNHEKYFEASNRGDLANQHAIESTPELVDIMNERNMICRELMESCIKPSVLKIGRNELCHCGSNKKFKRCHGA